MPQLSGQTVLGVRAHSVHDSIERYFKQRGKRDCVGDNPER